MKQSVFFLLLSLFLFSCNKQKEEEFTWCDTWLPITSATSTTTTTLAAGIRTIVNCYRPNLCYTYTRLDVVSKAGNIFEISTKGTAPCGPAVCPQAIVPVKDSITINTTQVGTYYLKFFNNTTLFKTDTVLVN